MLGEKEIGVRTVKNVDATVLLEKILPFDPPREIASSVAASAGM